MKNGGASLDRYKYVRTAASDRYKVIDVHDVFVKRSNVRVFLSYIGRLLLLANILLLLIEKVINHTSVLCNGISFSWQEEAKS